MLFCARPAPAGGRPSSEKRFSRSFHDRPQAVCRHGPVVCFAKPAGAGGLYRRHLCQRAALVLRAAAVHQDGAASARRLAGGVVGGDGVLPVAAARWLFLCAFPDANPQPRHTGRRPSDAAGRGVVDAAAVDRKRLWRAADIGLCIVAIGPVRGLDRAAVLRARRQQSAIAGLVRPHGSSRRARSLLPLRFVQYRQFPGAVVVSGAAGAGIHAAHAKPDLDRRLRAADLADRGLRGLAGAFACSSGERCADRGNRCAIASLDPAHAMDLARRGALGPPDRGDRAYFDRRRRGAAVVGAAAVALFVDLGAGVPIAAIAAA